MDPRRFDRLARLLATSTDRRTLGGIVAGVLAPLSDFDVTAAARKGGKRDRRSRKRERKRNRKQDRQRQRSKNEESETPAESSQTQTEARQCCSRNRCALGPGKNLGRCCFVDEDLSGRKLRGANLGQANLTGADLRNADLRGANLDQTCLVDTDLRDARLGGANLGTAIFCHTIMPDGSRNISGCTDATRCCPTCHADDPCPGGEVCCHGRCRV
jgi:hypothetical protein